MNSFSSATQRWQAVLERNPEADGHFFFAVRTTRIYCYPSCPARQPRQDRVEFFSTRQEAVAAGYRACLRCRSEGPTPRQRRLELVERACRRMAVEDPPPTLAALAGQAGLSSFHFHRVFSEVTGMGPKAYAMALRGQRLRHQLRHTDNITQAIQDSGFASSAQLYRGKSRPLGMTPGDFRRGAPGQKLIYALAPCHLGQVLVARSPQGICAIQLGDDPKVLLEELRGRFPQAELQPDAQLDLGQIVQILERPGSTLELPLDLQGTLFQQRVWQAIQEIPAGCTMTYSQLAQKLGMPQGQRAVARALAANPVAVAVPCHRVIGQGGDLRGYRWGLNRKAELLRRESEAP